VSTGGGVTRRSFIGAASAAAVGAAISSDVSAAPAADPPRLPVSILLRGGLSPEHLDRITKLSPQITIGREFDLASADVIFGNVSSSELGEAKKLRWVQCISAGVEHYPLEEMLGRDVILTNAQGCYGPQIAEHAFGLLFALTRGIGAMSRKRQWGYDGEPTELRGQTIGIIGLGGIGREVARRAKGMDMKVIAVDAEPMFAERFAMVDEVTLVDSGLASLLKRSDVVVCAAPHTPKSRGMIGAEQLAAMKSSAYFINVSRGKIVKTDALLDAVKAGKIAGAGLDVTDPEPLPADHALWRQENVVITPHIAGKSQLGYERVQNVFAENVARYVSALPLLNVVDKHKGY
jgi:phosphoglycerate dehydrogenase-like enzyme